MIDDTDVIRVGLLMIAQYGQRADLCANRRSKELRLRGYVEAGMLWDDVVAAIHGLERPVSVR
jgi:hypothetical protein